MLRDHSHGVPVYIPPYASTNLYCSITWVWTTCQESLCNGALVGDGIHDLWIISLMPYHRTTNANSKTEIINYKITTCNITFNLTVSLLLAILNTSGNKHTILSVSKKLAKQLLAMIRKKIKSRVSDILMKMYVNQRESIQCEQTSSESWSTSGSCLDASLFSSSYA